MYRFWRLTLSALCGLSLILGGAVGITRTQQREYACLRIAATRLLDLNTGFIAEDRRLLRAETPRPYELTSPDGRYIVRLRAESKTGRAGVYALSLERRSAPPGGPGEPILIQEEMTGNVDYSWSADSRHLAYVWSSPIGQAFVGVAELGDPGLVRKELVPVSDQVVYHRWSPDGAYFVYRVFTEQKLVVWSVREPGDAPLRELPLNGDVSDLVWSPRGDWLAVLQLGVLTGYMSLFSVQGEAHTFDLGTAWNAQQMVWSPDGRRVMLQYMANWPQWRLSVFDVSGAAQLGIAEVGQRGDAVSRPVAYWTADSAALAYAADRRVEGSDPVIVAWDWHRYQVAEQQDTVLAANVVHGPVRASERSDARLALVNREATGLRLRVMAADGNDQAAVIDGADDMGAPFWTPDGQHVGVVWATGRDQQRVVRLTWARADGSEARTLEDGYWDVRDVQVFAGQLAYMAWRGDSQSQPYFTAELLDLTTGQKRILAGEAGDLTQISMFYADPFLNALTFWWRDRAGQIGYQQFAPDGTRTHDYRIMPETPISIDGKVTFGDVWAARQFGSPVIALPSDVPAGSAPVAAFKLGKVFSDESLYLAAPDGRWSRLVRGGLTGLGDPLWSPDGSRLAFTESENRAPVALRIVAADGRLIRLLNKSDLYYNLTWTRCD